jgi:hypothetical protein
VLRARACECLLANNARPLEWLLRKNDAWVWVWVWVWVWYTQLGLGQSAAAHAAFSKPQRVRKLLGSDGGRELAVQVGARSVTSA